MASGTTATTPGQLTIGDVAAQAGVTVKTVRLYDRLGLVPATGRSSGNFRLFPADAVAWIGRIKRLQRLGLSLDEIRGVLAIYRRAPDT